MPEIRAFERAAQRHDLEIEFARRGAQLEGTLARDDGPWKGDPSPDGSIAPDAGRARAMPIEFESLVRIEPKNLLMGGDDDLGGLERTGFGIDQPGGRPEVAKAGALGMDLRGAIQSALQLRHGQPGHQHAKPPPAQMTIAPEERQQ